MVSSELVVTESSLLNSLREDSKWVVRTGIIILLIGMVALIAPMVAGVFIIVLVGLLLTFGGMATTLLALKIGYTKDGVVFILTGALMLLVGLYLIFQPAKGLIAITLMLAIYFVVIGVLTIITSIQLRPANHWVYVLINGLISLLLGYFIWAEWPLSGSWAVGVFLGVQLFFSGFTFVMVGKVLQKNIK